VTTPPPQQQQASLFSLTSRRVLCVRLRNWPIDRLRRGRKKQGWQQGNGAPVGQTFLSASRGGTPPRDTADENRPRNTARLSSPKSASDGRQEYPPHQFIQQPDDRRDRAKRAVSCDLDRPKLNRIATTSRVARSPNPQSTPHNPQSKPPPFALVQTAANRQTVVAVCEAASARGIRPGLTLAEAKALCPGLEHAEHDVRRDALGLRALGRWMMRFTPVVAVANGPEDPLAMPNALLLDVTGCERVFRGMDRLVAQVVASLERFGLSARVALGPNPAAAWGRTVDESSSIRSKTVDVGGAAFGLD
jgi:hypothetical protein